MSRARGAGCLRMRLDLEAPIDTPDGGGGINRNWLSHGRRWVQVRALSARETELAAHLHGEVSHEIQLRLDPAFPVNSDMRLVSAARIFRLLVVYDPDERQAMQLCLAKEIRR